MKYYKLSMDMERENDIVVGGRGYNAWWSKEYERRAADDL